MNEGGSETYSLAPERATPGRFAVLALAFATEAATAVTNLFSAATMVVAQHTLHQAYSREFKEITKRYDDTSGVGSGSPESQD